MANETDKAIKNLIEVVNSKKEEIGKAEKPNWNTNCNFVFDGSDRLNLNTVSDGAVVVKILAFLKVQKGAWEEACKDLGVDHEFKWSGFSYEDWKTDLQTRLNKINIDKNKKELAVLEARLNKIISPELRAQMELEEITKALS